MRRILITLAVVLVLGTVRQSHAATITYIATDLTDTTVGENLWEYSYRVGGTTFAQFEGFSIYFDYTKYKSLEDPPPGVADWVPLTFQPEPLVLLSNGIYDAQASVANPSLLNPFTVTFVWLGAGTPGAQPFDLYRVDPTSNPNDPTLIFGVDPGVTIPDASAIPEPSTLMLAASGLMFAARALRRRRGQT